MDLEARIKHFGKLVEESNHILLLQPDKLDTDSVASSLALKAIFDKLGKKTSAYSAQTISSSLQYIPGWQEFKKNLPDEFDLAVLVDGAP